MKARRLEGWRMFCTDQTRGMMGTGRDEIVEGRDRLLKTLESLLRSLDLYLNGYGESLNHFKQETDSIRYRQMENNEFPQCCLGGRNIFFKLHIFLHISATPKFCFSLV